MALHVTHDCFYGGYGKFLFFRQAIAKALGWTMYKNNEGTPCYDPPKGWGPYPDECLYGSWKEEPEDIIEVLMLHADCEGEIQYRHLRPLADRLAGLDLGPDWNPVRDQFVTGLRTCAAKNKRKGVVFQ